MLKLQAALHHHQPKARLGDRRQRGEEICEVLPPPPPQTQDSQERM